MDYAIWYGENVSLELFLRGTLTRIRYSSLLKDIIHLSLQHTLMLLIHHRPGNFGKSLTHFDIFSVVEHEINIILNILHDITLFACGYNLYEY